MNEFKERSLAAKEKLTFSRVLEKIVRSEYNLSFKFPYHKIFLIKTLHSHMVTDSTFGRMSRNHS